MSFGLSFGLSLTSSWSLAGLLSFGLPWGVKTVMSAIQLSYIYRLRKFSHWVSWSLKRDCKLSPDSKNILGCSKFLSSASPLFAGDCCSLSSTLFWMKFALTLTTGTASASEESPISLKLVCCLETTWFLEFFYCLKIFALPMCLAFKVSRYFELCDSLAVCTSAGICVFELTLWWPALPCDWKVICYSCELWSCDAELYLFSTLTSKG